jgi:4-amino-4-deoxy-L-arabinose transferase-like glycosyltransferase
MTTSAAIRMGWPAAPLRAAPTFHWATPAFTASAIALWVLLAGLTSSGQFADNIEQFVWAQSLEPGYWKHPPLPSWLLWGAVKLFGFWSGWTYLLSAACFGGTSFFLWRIAQRIAGDRVAAIAVLLQGLHLGFSQRAELYNHNTVLILFSSMTVWATLRALERPRLRDWALAGLCAALALLSKYQAVVLFGGILLALGLSGEWKRREVRVGCAVATLVALALLAPHFAALQGRDHSAIGYAWSRFHQTSWDTVLRSVLGYLVSQLRFHLPMVLAVALAAWTARRHQGEHVRPHDGGMPPPMARAWILGLVVWPMAAALLLPLGGGMALQAQWGLPALQFLVLSLAMRLDGSFPRLRVKDLLRIVVGVQLLSAAVFLWSPQPTDRRIDTAYPAQQLALAVRRDWESATTCPLKFVAGPSFEAGLVSVYSGSYAKVLEDGDFRKSPWIDPLDMQRDGWVALNATAPGDDEARQGHAPARGLPADLSWTIVPPATDCAAR